MDDYSQPTSSQWSYYSDGAFRQRSREAIDISRSIDSLEDKLTQFYKKYEISEILINRCIVPHEMIQRKRELQKQRQEEVRNQVKLADQITNIHQEINSLKASIAANSNLDELINELRTNNQVCKDKKQLQDQVDRYAQQENDTLIEIKTQKLEQQIERKLKSQETMIKILTKKIEQEQKKTEQYKKLKRQVETKMEGEKQLTGEAQAERKASKDQKLIEDRVKMLEEDIKRMKLAIARQEDKL